MNCIHLIGAGGHGRVVYDVMKAVDPDLSVVFHDSAWQSIQPIPPVQEVRGVDEIWESKGPLSCFVAIGNCETRLELLRRLQSLNHLVPSFVHPSAVVSPHARIGEGVVVMAGCVVQTQAQLGDGTIINTSASVDHDCVIGAGSHIAPGAHLAGGVSVGDASFLGAGTVVRELIQIGSKTVIGAGSAVVCDMPDQVVAFGNPARVRSAREL